MRKTSFQKLYDRYVTTERMVQRIARKYAKSDYDLYEELVQEGVIRLWELRVTPDIKNPDAWVRQAIKFRMIDFLRKDRPDRIRMESLDVLLARGDQLEKDPRTGVFTLIPNPDVKEVLPKDFVMGKAKADDDRAQTN